MRPLVLLTTALALSGPAFATDSQSAILRCDPGTYIKAIDGDGKRFYKAGYSQYFDECAIPLTPGSHTLDICMDLVSIASPFGPVCAENYRLALDAHAGRTYRIRMAAMNDRWKTWMEDVTEAEAGLVYVKLPAEKTAPSSHQNENETTIVVVHASPEHAYLGFQEGVAYGKWFKIGKEGTLKVINSKRSRPVTDGYHLLRVSAGDTFAMTWGRVTKGSIYTANGIVPCGDFPVRVYEDVPGGKVLFLGHLSLRPTDGGYAGEYGDDLAAARAYVDAHFPDLAGRLEAARFRELRAANLCFGTGSDLIPTAAISPADASADSK